MKKFITVYCLNLEGKEVEETIASESIKNISINFNEDVLYPKNFRNIKSIIETNNGEKYYLKTDGNINKNQINGKVNMLVGAIYYPNRQLNNN